jgi:predicted kinase
MNKPELVLLIGNIGSGKSTFCKKLISKGFSHVIISRDSLRYMIGAGKYRFEPKIEKAIWDSELNIIDNFMFLGQNILVDEVGITKSMRARYSFLARKWNYSITVIEMPRYSMKKSVNRRLKDPHGQPDRKLWESVWKKFDAMYEKPTKSEGFAKIIKLNDKQKSFPDLRSK